MELFIEIVGHDPIVQGLVGDFVIALLNLVGASLVLVWRNPELKWLDATLGFAAGVMLSASFTSLLLPGIEFASAPGYRALSVDGLELSGIIPVLIGFLIGTIVLDQGERWIHYFGLLISGRLARKNQRTDSGDDGYGMPVTATRDPSGLVDSRVMSVVLFTVAITLHNIPEGLAVGVGFGSGDVASALTLMFAIGIQNVPEGLAVAVAAINAGLGRSWYAAIAGIRAGLVEIPLALFGAWAVTVAAPLLPYAMGFAAGGMLYVIGGEILPETHSHGHERIATLGVLFGAALMLTLDVVLG